MKEFDKLKLDTEYYRYMDEKYPLDNCRNLHEDDVITDAEFVGIDFGNFDPEELTGMY